MLNRNRKRSPHNEAIKCLSSIPMQWLAGSVHSEAAFLLNPNSKRFQNDSRLKQLHEINSCEQLNEMEEYLRIDCSASANSFVLCFNFDKRKTEKQWPNCQPTASQTHSPLNSIRNSLVDKNYTCSLHMRMQFIYDVLFEKRRKWAFFDWIPEPNSNNKYVCTGYCYRYCRRLKQRMPEIEIASSVTYLMNYWFVLFFKRKKNFTYYINSSKRFRSTFIRFQQNK